MQSRCSRCIPATVPPSRYRRAVHVAVVRLLMVPGDIPDLDPFQRPAWQRRGACRGAGSDRWFPERGASTAPLIGTAVNRTLLLKGEMRGQWDLLGGLDEASST